MTDLRPRYIAYDRTSSCVNPPASSAIEIPPDVAGSEEATAAVLVQHLEMKHAHNWKKICDGKLNNGSSTRGGKS